MTLPQITITKSDRERLLDVATDALTVERPDLAASMLLSEIGRATVVPADALPVNVVAMGSDVELRDNITGQTRRLHIVYPQEERSGAISVLTPLGVALLGLAEGDTIDWCTATGHRRSVTVLRTVRK